MRSGDVDLGRVPLTATGAGTYSADVVFPRAGAWTAQVAVRTDEFTSPVTTLEVVTQMTPLTARTWVRPDGLVLRQEVPFPFVRLMLERLPERFIGTGAQDQEQGATP